MIIERFSGIAALSQFQKKKLLAECSKLQNDIIKIEAQYIHFAYTSSKLTTSETSKLHALLTYGTPCISEPTGELFLVVPRPGTISPWSSKATDIAKNCGLSSVERIERGVAYYVTATSATKRSQISKLLHDRMTETVMDAIGQADVLFQSHNPKSFSEILLQEKGKQALKDANKSLGLALSNAEIDYLHTAYAAIKRNPSDVELLMFAVVNSEHCRHKIFNAQWVVNGKDQPKTLFKMIKNTYEKSPIGVLSAYSDNAAVLKGPKVQQFYPDQSSVYSYHAEPAHLVIKAETHNHPTAISPYAGAATGIGGEIRDEGATGRGARSKMGFAGFSVSNLNLKDLPQPWESDYGKPELFSSPLDIMIEAPLGGAAFANEFGRVNLGGYFRTYEQSVDGNRWGYHKPLMVAGGLGNIRDKYVHKNKITAGTKLIVLGGPAMLIGLGGGAASSMQSGKSEADLDFASVQRGNGEMQRRAQEVISACWTNDNNPIISIHDVGAGGLSNALPELVHDNNLGAEIELRDIPSIEPGMSPLEIWCNEAQERYVLAIAEKDLPRFEALCQKERCPFAVVGAATDKPNLVVRDRLFKNMPVNIPLQLIFGDPPAMTRVISSKQKVVSSKSLDLKSIKLEEAVNRVLHMPSVGSKKFLITIGDRTVGGLSARDQMVGPWQVPVSDVAVTAASYEGFEGEAMAIGERAPLGLINAPASVHMAVGETLTNIVAAPIAKLADIKLSANWMAAAGYGAEDEKLFEGVKALGEEFCPSLGISIPVGKDSLSMRATWKENGNSKSVTSPLSLIISAFSPVTNTEKVLTPQLKKQKSSLILIDLGLGRNRLGGSALSQAYNQTGNTSPDIEANVLKQFFDIIQELNTANKLLAYHDRSDGGLFTTLVEMAFAGRCGLDIDISSIPGDALDSLFNEEIGAVIQIADNDKVAVLKKLETAIGSNAYLIGSPLKSQDIIIKNQGEEAYRSTRAQLEAWWTETSYHIQKLRDNPATAKQEYDAVNDNSDPGISPKITFELSKRTYSSRPKAAIFREQGINGQVEMAAAFEKAGFAAIDVHLSELTSGRHSLNDFSILAACGGFSYGDVLGAGEGWAKSILFNPKLRREFQYFFERSNTLSLGICNGCQMLSTLKELIPGTDHWPRFLQNESGRYEARLVSVKVNDSPSIFFKGMAGSILPIPVAHGEGKAVFNVDASSKKVLSNKLVPLQYVDNYGKVTKQYPLNPNGSEHGITALTSTDGRATILMPHPERVFLTKQLSWHPDGWGNESPWFKIFQNAREWIG